MGEGGKEGEGEWEREGRRESGRGMMIMSVQVGGGISSDITPFLWLRSALERLTHN